MPPPPPNILWIVTTQWRGPATGYAGDPNARTPHLDALAAEAVNYVQAVTPHPFGPFARAALLTGMASPENGVRDYYDPLPQQARTVAHRLRERGYVTAFFGKWHLYRRDPGAPLVGEAHAQIVVPPARRGGFEFWEGFESGFLLNDPWLHGSRLPEPVQFPGYQSAVVCARAGAWIWETGNRRPETGKREGGGAEGLPSPVSRLRAARRPWFCVVSLEPPHPPYEAPAADVAPRDPRALLLPPNVPRGGEVEARARRELAGYYAHLEATDQAVGRLLAQTPRKNTVVVFTSVHGDMHGAHGLFRKGWPHEESVRVPLLVRGARPEGSGPGKTSNALVSLLDLPRWALEWAGAGEPKIQNPKRGTEMQRISMPGVVRLPHQCDRPWRGVRTRSHKLILNEDGTPWLFFDLARDPGEERNLVDDPGRTPERAELQRWL
ncbi:MAG: sulfatase-like hydrolase/transferase [Opitutaceae bacterium]|nr:sulfatase-like hydrolase/transferase [Opitutaceae bacterium]